MYSFIYLFLIVKLPARKRLNDIYKCTFVIKMICDTHLAIRLSDYYHFVLIGLEK